MTTKMNHVEDLLQLLLKDLYSCETQLIEALPKLAETAHNPQLKTAFKDHLQETKKQKVRLEEIAKKLSFDIKGETCSAIKGMIKETDDFIKRQGEPEVMDAGLIAYGQKVEHYEIGSYGTVRQFAKDLGYREVEQWLNESLNEEKNADNALNKIAVTVNPLAESVHH